MIYLFYTNAFLLLYSKGLYTILIHLYWYYMVYSQSHTLKLYLYYLLFYTVLSNRYCTKLHTPEVTSRLNCYIIVHKVLLL